MKRNLSVILFLLLLGGCGDTGVMDGLGERSHEYVAGSTTTTLPTTGTFVSIAPSGVIPVERVRWFNEGIEGEVVSEPSVVIQTVWLRGRDEGRFIQSSPAEISAALPQIEFPALLPEQSDWITSQLVYDAASGTLDVEISAAFGVWSVPPYTDDNGRIAVLRVGQASSTAQGGTGIISSAVEDGITLMWSSGFYRYELFCRRPTVDDLCWQMVESVAPLSAVSPGPVEQES